MSSLRNAIPRRAHKERDQPHDRKKYGLLEKHKDYKERANVFHMKENIIKRVKEKAASRNPDEFYFKMISTRTKDGVHLPGADADETQDMGYILQKLRTEEKKIEKMTYVLHSIDNQSSDKHIYFAEDREEAKVMEKQHSKGRPPLVSSDGIPDNIRGKVAASYRELEARRTRVQQLKKIYMDMGMQRELQKKGRKRTLREDEIVCPTSKPLYKWKKKESGELGIMILYFEAITVLIQHVTTTDVDESAPCLCHGHGEDAMNWVKPLKLSCGAQSC